MARKQATVPVTTAVSGKLRTPKTTETTDGISQNPPARKAAPRVKAARHRVEQAPIAQVEITAPHELVSKTAYGYWIARGSQGGNPMDDWFRAEAEVRLRV